MVNAVAFVLSGVYMVAKLRSSDTDGSDDLTCSTIILSAQPSNLHDSLLLFRDEACGSVLRLANAVLSWVAGLKHIVYKAQDCSWTCCRV